MAKRCAYCGEIKDKFSREHIIPAFMRGNNSKDILLTGDVCEKCNTTFGVFVDGAFAKNAFYNFDLHTGFRCFLDQEVGRALPLAYFGVIKEFSVDSEMICEGWLGPAGDQIFHVRAPNADFAHYAGGDPRRQKMKGRSRVYFFTRSQHPVWVITLLKSVKAQFKNSKIFFLTEGLIDGFRQIESFEKAYSQLRDKDGVVRPSIEAPESEVQEIRRIEKIPGMRGHDLQLKLDTDVRFMAKVAMGIGYSLMGNEFIDTTSRQKLFSIARRGASSPEIEGLICERIFDPVDEVQRKLVAMRGGLVFLVLILGDRLVLCFFGPQRLKCKIEICSISELSAAAISSCQYGLMYLTVPPLDYVGGPFQLPNWLAHKAGNLVISEIRDLEKLSIEDSSLPPFDFDIKQYVERDVSLIAKELLTP